MRRSVVLPFFVALLTSCAAYQFEGSMKPTIPAAGKDDIPLFTYDRSVRVDPTFFGKDEDRKTFTVKSAKWAVKDFPEMKNDHAKAYFYEPKDKSKKHPSLIVLPPTGGDFEIVKIFGNYFAEKGFAVVAMRRRESFFNPDMTQKYNEALIRQAVIDARRAVDFLDTLDYVDHDKTCVMGISLGGIIGALAMETDPRIHAAGFLVSAGNLADVLATSGYGRVSALRQAFKDEFHVNSKQLYSLAEELLRPVDPVTYADRLDPARIIMVNAAFDDIIRKEVVLKTRTAYGNPELRFLPASHYTAIGFSGHANELIYRHFAKVLALD